MGWFSNLFSGGDTIKGALEGTGTLAKDLRTAFTGEIPADKRAEFELKAQEIESQIILAQSKINEAEAKSSSFFVAGARPAILWIGALGLFYYFLFMPIFYDLFIKYFNFELQAINGNELMNLVVAILGLGAYRTYEKAKGVQNNH